VFLDEAKYWLPQEKPSYLYPGTYRRLLDAFHTLATMGRSLGLAPMIVTQRIAEAEMNVFMKVESSGSASGSPHWASLHTGDATR
jgi:hypothetical protein